MQKEEKLVSDFLLSCCYVQYKVLNLRCDRDFSSKRSLSIIAMEQIPVREGC